jgi:hypothetical protein
MLCCAVLQAVSATNPGDLSLEISDFTTSSGNKQREEMPETRANSPIYRLPGNSLICPLLAKELLKIELSGN